MIQSSLIFGGGALSHGTSSLQPSQKFLFARKHVAGFITQLSYDLVAGFGEPGHTMRCATIFFFVRAFATPIENRGAALFPVAHGIPMASFVRAQVLIRAETGIAPEFGDLVEARINSSGYALPFRIACANQQNVAAGLDVAHQRANTLHGIGRYERLFREDIFQLLVVVVREREVVSLFDLQPALLCLPNAAA